MKPQSLSTRSLAAPGWGAESAAAAQVISHVRALIESGALGPGDRLIPERELARVVGVSRPTVRAGLRSLAAMGVVRTRQGAGTFVIDGPPALDSKPLGMLAALHGMSRDSVFESRRVLEAGTAALAAARATGHQLAAIADEVTEMFAAVDDPQTFLRHDVRFHQAVAAASNNPILGVLIEMLASLFYEQRKVTIEKARDLRESADTHRRIYRAIRSRDAEAARKAMDEHLRLAQAAQEAETAGAVVIS